MELFGDTKAQAEKRSAALSSVIAAFVLTGFKLFIGLLTNSLGILSEAAHSGIDLIAAIATCFAVYVSDKPADEGHHYGHGKIENLSAFIETILLVITCIWIIQESIERLFFKAVQVDASIWAFLVIITSILIDISRTRVLYRAARAHNSQALEADALHFSTDIWSSSVVLVGLVGLLLSQMYPALAFLRVADAIAALGVALISIWISFKLGKRTVYALLDGAPEGLDVKIKQSVEELEGVTDCHNIRVRNSGPKLFVDVHVSLDGNQTLAKAHDLTELIELTIQRLIPQSDVTVHPEPVEEIT
ncbi:MAG: cation diffusion facilitator family transporter [Candidatus Omnitrophota bacterium]